MDIYDYLCKDERTKQLFSELPSQELQNLGIKTYPKGECLLYSGSYATSVFVILDGICNIERDTDVFLSEIQSQLGFLDTVGIHEIIHNIPRVGTIRAHHKSTVIVIPKEVYLRWVDEYPRFALRLSTNVIDRLFKNIGHMNQCTKYPVYYAVISYLLSARELFNRKTHNFTGGVKLDNTRQYIADLTGKDVRSVNRAIQVLKKNKLITLLHGKIYLNQQQANRLQEEKMKVMDIKIQY